MTLELINARDTSPNGQQLEWSESDDLLNFQSLNRQNAHNEWRNSRKWLRYCLNSQGYRAPEWAECAWDQSLVVMGCSNIFGVGLAEHQTAAALVSKVLGRPVINLGFSGAGPQLIWQNLIRLTAAGIRPWGIVIAWPPASRFSEATPDPLRFIQHGSWSPPEMGWPLHLITHPHQLASNLYYYSVSSGLMTDSPVWQWQWSNSSTEFIDLPDLKPFQAGDFARDCRHPGPKCNILMADKIIKCIKASGHA